MSTIVKPAQGLLQGRAYRPSRQTDVQSTWRKYGWSPIHPRAASDMDLMYIYQTKQKDEHHGQS